MVNLRTLNRAELLKYSTERCEHRHTFLSHPGCFNEDIDNGRLGFLDIEASNLKANFGIMLSYCIKDEMSNHIFGRTITKREIQGPGKTYDKDLLQDCIDDIRKFKRIVTYFGTGYDNPFLLTRSLKWDLDYPLYGEIKHFDLYYLAKSKLNLHRKSLEVVTKWLDIEGKNHVEWDHWQDAVFRQEQRPLNYIFDHNKRDVVILQKAYERLNKYTRGIFKSI